MRWCMGIQVYAYTNVVTILETKDLLCLVARDALLNLEDVAVKTLALATCMYSKRIFHKPFYNRPYRCMQSDARDNAYTWHAHQGRKSEGGGAVRFRPDTKTGKGGGGEGGVLCTLQARYESEGGGGGGGCLAEEGEVPYMKGGGGGGGGLKTCIRPHTYHARTSCNPSWRK